MILQLKKCPYRHDVQFNVKLSTSYLSFIWVFDLDMFLSFFSPWFFSLSTVTVFRPNYFSSFFILVYTYFFLFLPEHLCQGLTTRDRKGGLCLAHLLAAWFVWNHLLFTNWLSEIEFSSSNFFSPIFCNKYFFFPPLHLLPALDLCHN